jgi:hypothetical protein
VGSDLDTDSSMTYRSLVRFFATTVLAVASTESCVPAQHVAAGADAVQDPDLLRVQREIWEVWYAGDTARVRALTPGLITLGDSDEPFADQEAVVRESAQFHAAGGRLLELTFPQLRVQR